MSETKPPPVSALQNALEKALGASGAIAFSFNRDTGAVLYLGPAFSETVGAPPLSLAEFLDRFHEEDRSRVQDGSPCDVRLRIAGGHRWYALSASLSTDGSGANLLVGVLFDVHERKTEEEKRKISEETLRYVFDAAPFPVTVTTPDGEVLYVNDRVYDFYRLNRGVDVAVELRTTDFYVDPEARRAIVEKLMRDGEARDVVIHMRRRDGSTYWASFSARIIKFAGKTAIISAQFDIDERKRAEQRLRESEEKFSKVFMNAPLIMGITDVETGRIVDVNREFERIVGYSATELAGRTYAEAGIVDPAERERVRAALLSKGSIKGFEMELTVRDGRKLDIVYNGEIINIDGRPTILSIVEDVTEKRRRAEQELKAQRIEALGVLAGGIAHDFNNILTGILGNLSLAKAMGGLSLEAAERIEECEKASRRAGELSHQLLTFAKGGAPRKSILKPGPLVEETASFALRGSNVVPVFEIAPELPAVEADRGQLTQVFSNLFINAAQAMPMGGEVRVTVAGQRLEDGNEFGLAPGGYVAVTVADSGCGIPPEALDRVFDPYYTTKPHGSGLGLSTVYSIVKRHGGCVTVSSGPGEGAEFKVLVPSCGSGTEKIGTNGLPHAQKPGIKVLVMDDEAMIRGLAKSIAAHLGYEAVVAVDGAEAVVLAKKAVEEGEPFHAAILDLTVPGGMGGLEAAGLMATASPATRLIVSSGYSNAPVLADPSAYGFSGVIPKPYAAPAVAAELARVLGGS